METQRQYHIPTGSHSQFWLVPVVCGLAAILLGFSLIAVDHRFPGLTAPFLYQGSSSGARSSLNSIVTAMISLTGMVFSLAFVAVQLSSGQYSPRVVQIYMRDRIIQVTFGVFVATFLYALVVAQSVKADARVPRIAASVAALLVVGSALTFMLYVGRVAYMMRASTIIAEIADMASALLEETYPAGTASPLTAGMLPEPHRVIAASQRGVLAGMNTEALAKQAAQAGCVVELRLRIGDFVPKGAPLFTVHGEPDDLDRLVAGARKQLTLGTERSMAEDVAFGFRLLVDMIEKALSPSVNDPTTACQALDALHDLLRQLATRAPVSEAICGPDGEVRLVIPRYQFADLLEVTVREARTYGSDAAQVPDRIDRMLADLAEAARPEHRDAVRRMMRQIDAKVSA